MIVLFVGCKKDDQVVIGQIVGACSTNGREVVEGSTCQKRRLARMRDFRPPQRGKCDLRSSGMLRSVYCWLFTKAPGQPIGPIVWGQDPRR